MADFVVNAMYSNQKKHLCGEQVKLTTTQNTILRRLLERNYHYHYQNEQQQEMYYWLATFCSNKIKEEKDVWKLTWVYYHIITTRQKRRNRGVLVTHTKCRA